MLDDTEFYYTIIECIITIGIKLVSFSMLIHIIATTTTVWLSEDNIYAEINGAQGIVTWYGHSFGL